MLKILKGGSFYEIMLSRVIFFMVESVLVLLVLLTLLIFIIIVVPQCDEMKIFLLHWLFAIYNFITIINAGHWYSFVLFSFSTVKSRLTGWTVPELKIPVKTKGPLKKQENKLLISIIYQHKFFQYYYTSLYT